MSQCPCGSRRAFSACCGPWLAGRPAPTAEALMRSRYTAYSLGNLAYIAETCAGEAALTFDRKAMEQTLPGTEWLGLAITATEAGGETDDTGSVTFTVRFRQHGQLHTQSETSQFRRIGGAWRYIRGEVAMASRKATPSAPIGRNDPCPCGSGKKYKKCCGAVTG